MKRIPKLDEDLERRCVSRRRPRLRVVGEARPGVRKAAVTHFDLGYTKTFVSVEVFTFGEWAAMAPAERPAGACLIPEVGYASMVLVSGKMTEEMEDIDQSVRLWRGKNGGGS